MKSDLFKLDWKDIGRGFLIAVISSAITSLYATISSGSLPTLAELQTAGLVGLGAGLAYIIKNVLTNSEDKLLKSEPK
jgi:hypothetical protein